MPMSLETVRAALLSGDTIMVTQIAEPESKAKPLFPLRYLHLYAFAVRFLGASLRIGKTRTLFGNSLGF